MEICAQNRNQILQQKINIQMESAKGSRYFKFDRFDVDVTPFSDQKLAITVTDPLQKIQFHESMLTLTEVKVATLMKALEKTLIQVKMDMNVIKSESSQVLRLDLLVASQFLKPVQETIYLKKSRDLNESEILKKAIDGVTEKMKSIRMKGNEEEGCKIHKGTVIEIEKSFNVGNNYESLGSIKLRKGKYLITFSCLARVTNQLMYLFFNNTQLIQNSAFYAPNNHQYIPYVFRKIHYTMSEGEVVNFNTYCAQSYPISVRNAIVTAQEIKE